MLKDLEQAGYERFLSLHMRGSREPYVYEEEPERCMHAGAEWMYAHMV